MLKINIPFYRYVALIEFMQPSILINDLELIKKVTVKDFDSFNDTPQRINENDDPVLARLLRILKGIINSFNV